MSSKVLGVANPLNGRAGSTLRHAARAQHGWVSWLARAGYATRGLLYIIIGGLAALAAFGYGGDTTDSHGALRELYAQPFGQILLVLAAVGLFGYAAFLIYRAALDPEGEARQAWGPAKRAWWLVVGLLHASLGLYAVALVGGEGASAPSPDAKSRTAELLSWTPVGPWLVLAIGIGLLLGAAYQLSRAWRAQLDEQLDLSTLGHSSRRWVVRLSRLGIAARAGVAAIAGGFLLVAATTANAREAKGFGESLAAVRGMPFGGWLFGAVALGLLAFGFYELIEARYRRVLGRRV
jgi:Domain of Unknown Function (DUF1206)